MTEVSYNHDFTEKETGKQIVVTNNLGRTVEYGELVFLGGYFGEVREFDGIANGAAGRINIDADREISTSQVEATDTFTVGNTLHFLPGGSGAAGTIVDTPEEGSIPIGVCTEEQGTGGAQTAVSLRPFIQRAEARPGQAFKVAETIVDADATGGQAVDIPTGAKIVDAWAIATATSASGSVKLAVGGGGSDICTAFDMAADGAVARMAAGVDDSLLIVGSDGVELVTNGAADRGLVYIAYL